MPCHLRWSEHCSSASWQGRPSGRYPFERRPSETTPDCAHLLTRHVPRRVPDAAGRPCRFLPNRRNWRSPLRRKAWALPKGEDNGNLRHHRLPGHSCFATWEVSFPEFPVVAVVGQKGWTPAVAHLRKARRRNRGRIPRVLHRGQARSSHHEHSEQQSGACVAGVRNRSCRVPVVRLSSVARNRRKRLSRRIPGFGASDRRSGSGDWSWRH